MDLLRQLQKNYTTLSVGNYRPVQPLYNRIVRASFQAPADTISTTSAPRISTGSIATNAAEQASPAATVGCGLGSSAVRMTAGLYLLMLFATSSVIFIHEF